MTSQQEAQAMAVAAAAFWGNLATVPKLIAIRENIVFQVQFADGRMAALRLHRAGYQSRAAIEAELEWTAKLAQAGLAVPAPLPDLSGAMTVVVGGRFVSVVDWISGTPIGAAAEVLQGSAKDQAGLYCGIGKLLGDLHKITDSFSFSAGFSRPNWDVEGFIGPDPLWGRYWDNPALDAKERALLLAARDQLRQELPKTGGDCGLIHADVLRENILATADGLALIDFDDSGFGFRLYDLGTAIVQNLEEPHLGDIAAGLLEGYRQTRPEVQVSARQLVMFTLLRGLASAGWVISRADATDPRQRLYAQRALGIAKHFLDGSTPWKAQ
ncbi:MAG: phosphotransferase [Albidovulum sp.]